MTNPDTLNQFDWGTDADGNGYTEDLQTIREATAKVRDAFTAINARLYPTGAGSVNFNSDWAALCGKWSFLNTTVRAMRLSANLSWGMPPGPEAQFSYRFVADMSPINKPIMTWFRTVLPVINGLADGLRQSDSPVAVADCLSQPSARIFEPAAFAREADTAAKILEDLQESVREVDAAGWPDQ